MQARTAVAANSTVFFLIYAVVMATPLVPVISTKLIVSALPVAGQPPQLTFSAQIVSQLDTLTLGPLTVEQFIALTTMANVPGQMSIEKIGPATHVIVKQA